MITEERLKEIKNTKDLVFLSRLHYFFDTQAKSPLFGGHKMQSQLDEIKERIKTLAFNYQDLLQSTSELGEILDLVEQCNETIENIEASKPSSESRKDEEQCGTDEVEEDYPF